MPDTDKGGTSDVAGTEAPSSEVTSSDIMSSDVTSSDVTSSDVTSSDVTTTDVTTTGVTSASCCTVTTYFANTSCSGANQVRTLETVLETMVSVSQGLAATQRKYTNTGTLADTRLQTYACRHTLIDTRL